MNLRPMLAVNGLLIVFMAAISAWGWQALPDGAMLPTRFDLEGNISQSTDKQTYLAMMPAIAFGLTVLFWVLPKLDPRRTNIEASSKFWNAASILSCGLLAYLHALIVANAAGYRIDLIGALIPGLSVMFIGLGNYLAKTRSNWFGGVRTPWSLSSEYSWERTHRWSGRLMVASGLASLVAWFVVDTKTAFFILIGLVIATAVISIVLSYVFWRADPNRAPNGAR
jgi:uncharacterized membrane protein